MDYEETSMAKKRTRKKAKKHTNKKTARETRGEPNGSSHVEVAPYDGGVNEVAGAPPVSLARQMENLRAKVDGVEAQIGQNAKRFEGFDARLTLAESICAGLQGKLVAGENAMVHYRREVTELTARMVACEKRLTALAASTVKLL